MKKAIYKQIVKTIENEEWDFDQVLEILIGKFPEEKSETLRAIQVQEYQRRVKRTHKSQTSEYKRKEIYNNFKSGISILYFLSFQFFVLLLLDTLGYKTHSTLINIFFKLTVALWTNLTP